ncbi:IclR family transcriptional regulator domain-containing protein [Glutamicibacter sp. X7]
MEQRQDYFVKSTEKTLAVLLAFNRGGPNMTVSQVAAATEQTRASARRFLLTLVDLGYLENEDGTFRLTPRVLDIGSSYLSGLTLPKIARGHLQRLARELDETAALCVLEGQDVLYLERVLAPRLHSMSVSIGNRLPAWVTSMGRVLIAAMPSTEREQFLGAIQLQSYTERTITDPQRLGAELDAVVAQGWALVNQELDEGLRGLAVPVRRGGTLLGALNISVQRGQTAPEHIRSVLLPRLQQAAKDIADDFGGRLAS